MIATRVTAPRGPALLAKAGVSLIDAQWLYAQRRAGAADKTSSDFARIQAIKARVQAFLRQQMLMHAEPACA